MFLSYHLLSTISPRHLLNRTDVFVVALITSLSFIRLFLCPLQMLSLHQHYVYSSSILACARTHTYTHTHTHPHTHTLTQTPKEQPQDTTHVKTQTHKHTSSAYVFHRLPTFTQIFLSPFDILHSGQRRMTSCKIKQNLCDILRCDILR